MDNETGVTSDSSTDTGSQPATVVEEVAEAPQTQKPPKGFVPYQALEEERAKRKEAEEKLNNALAPSEDQDVYSDEGKLLKGEIKDLKDTLRSIESKEARREAESEFPVLKERKSDFDAFLEDEENSRLRAEIDYFSIPENLEKKLKTEFNYRKPDEKMLIIVPQ